MICIRNWRAALALFGTLIVASCGTAHAPLPVPSAAPPTLELLPGLDSLPPGTAWSLGRTTSAVINLPLDQGNLRNAGMVGPNVALTSSASQNSAVFYNLAPNYNGQAVPYIAPYQLEWTHSGGELWLAYSNYGTGRWQIHQSPFAAGGHSFDVYLDSDSGSRSGSFAVAFISTRGAQPVLESASLIYPDAPAPGNPVEYIQPIYARDGQTMLATSIFLPYAEVSPLIPDPPYPVVLSRTPYNKLAVDPQLISTATSLNVAVMLQYWRGRRLDSGWLPDSTGSERLFDDHAGPVHFDAIDTVDWLEERLFYNGDLALTGPSALGLASYQSVPGLGSRIRGFFHQISAADVAQWVMLENGCFGQYNVETFLSDNDFPAELFTSVLDAYRDADSNFFASYNFNALADAARAPGFHETGWWDVDVNETIRSWQALNINGGNGALGQQWLVIGPWTHAGIRGDSAGVLSFPNSGDIHDPQVLPTGYDGIQFLLATLSRNPFFVPQVNKVAYYMVGPEGDTTGINNRWLTSPSWPPAGLPLLMYLAGPDLLDTPPGAASELTYQADPQQPVATVGGGLLSFGPLEPGPQDGAALLSNTPSGLFVHSTIQGLANDVTVAGEIVLTLRLRLDSTQTQPSDTDIAAWLIDGDSGGNQTIVANGIVRLSDYLARTGGGPVQLDTPYNVSFSLGSRAYNFAAGHSIELFIAGSNSPQYAVNPGNGDSLPGINPAVAQDVVLMFGEAAGQCQLLLPVLGPQP